MRPCLLALRRLHHSASQRRTVSRLKSDGGVGAAQMGPFFTSLKRRRRIRYRSAATAPIHNPARRARARTSRWDNKGGRAPRPAPHPLRAAREARFRAESSEDWCFVGDSSLILFNVAVSVNGRTFCSGTGLSGWWRRYSEAST